MAKGASIHGTHLSIRPVSSGKGAVGGALSSRWQQHSRVAMAALQQHDWDVSHPVLDSRRFRLAQALAGAKVVLAIAINTVTVVAIVKVVPRWNMLVQSLRRARTIVRRLASAVQSVECYRGVGCGVS